MSIEYPERNELVLSCSVGISLVKRTHIAGVLKCVMQNKETMRFIFSEDAMNQIAGFMTEQLFLDMAEKADNEDRENGTRFGASLGLRSMQLFEDHLPVITKEDVENPPTKNGVTGHHLHVYPHYIALDMDLFSGRKKVIVMQMVTAARFIRMLQAAIEQGNEVLSRFGGRA